MKSTTDSAFGRLTRNSRLSLSSGHGAFGLPTVVTVFLPRRTPASPMWRINRSTVLDAVASHLLPDLARAVEAEAVGMDALDLLPDLVIAPGACRAPSGRFGAARGTVGSSSLGGVLGYGVAGYPGEYQAPDPDRRCGRLCARRSVHAARRR